MRQIGILLLISTVLCACAALDNRQRDKAFETAATMYGNAIRWNDFEEAEQLRRPMVEQPPQPSPADHIKVTAYETLRTSHTDGGSEATLEVRITYYHKDQMTLKSVVDQQVWKYDADEQHWYITTALPEFR